MTNHNPRVSRQIDYFCSLWLTHSDGDFGQKKWKGEKPNNCLGKATSKPLPAQQIRIFCAQAVKIAFPS